MAPTIKRKTGRSRASAHLARHAAGASVSSADSLPIGSALSLTSTKRDKRQIKHSTFVSRIEKSTSSSKNKRRRRPGKKLVTDLKGLEAALPDIERRAITSTGLPSAESGNGGDSRLVIKQKSLQSRPGAMKRKAKLQRIEMERFGKNMAQLAGDTGAHAAEVQRCTQLANVEGVQNGGKPLREPSTGVSAGRWAALRGFIMQTMEQKEEFKGS